MRFKRIFGFWVLDYLTGMALGWAIFILASTIFDFPALNNAIYVYVPLKSLLFSWLACRTIKKDHPHRFVLANVWLLLDILGDFLVLKFLYQAPQPFVTMIQPHILYLFASKYFAAIAGAWLGFRSTYAVGSGMPSPRSELASQLSSVQRRQGRV